MYHSDDKLGWCFDLAEELRKFSKEVRDNREIRDIRERNAKVLQGITLQNFFPLLRIP